MAILASAVVLASCTAAPDPHAGSSVNGVSESGPSSVDPSISAGGGGLLYWEVVAGPAELLESTSYVSGDAVLFVARGPTADGWVSEIRVARRDGTSDSMVLDPDAAILEASLIDGDAVLAVRTSDWSRVDVTRLVHGYGPQLLISLPLLDAGQPEIALAGHSLLMMGSPAESACLRSLDLAHPERGFSDVACGEEGKIWWWLTVAPDGAVSWLESDSFEAECARLLRLELGSLEPSPAVEGQCVSRGAASATSAVWNTSPDVDPLLGTNWFDVPLLVESGGVQVELGSSVSGSALFCGDYLYWLKDMEGLDKPTAEVRRWRPGGEIEAVYRSPRGDDGYDKFATSGAVCTDGFVFFQRASGDTGAPDELLVSPSLGWTFSVE